MAITATIPNRSIPIATFTVGGARVEAPLHEEWARFFRDLQVRSGGVSGVVQPPSGGTGFSSYSVGDMLYADTSTSFARLNAVTSGNALISNGVGAPPSWGKVNLTTTVDGVLQEANGGTGFPAFGSGVSVWLQAPTSANLKAAVPDATGIGGALVFADSPELITPDLDQPTSGDLTNCTGYPASALTGAALAAGVTASSLTSVGTITTGVWNGGAVASTGTVTGTNLSGTNTGDQTSVSGNAGTATALQTSRNINGVAFNGAADITVTAAAGTLSGATLAAGVTASSLTSVGTLTSLTMSGGVTGVTDLTTNGNTILGNASTDTLNVGNGGLIKDSSGRVGIGGTSSGSMLETFRNSGATNPGTDDTFPSMTSGALLKNLSATNGCYVALSLVAANAAGTEQGFSVVSQSTSSGHSPVLLFMARTAAGTTTERGRIDEAGQLILQTAGKGISIKEGSNAKMGTATLVAGTVVVSTTAVTANSRIFLTAQSLGTVTVGQGLAVSARTAGTSFTITSGNAVDTSVVGWLIFEPS